jgi:hypothetical protein
MVLASAVHYSDRLKAAVDVVGISNFVTFLENTEDYRRDLRRAEYGDERDPAMRAHLEAIAPLKHVEKINVPMLVVQGENDPRVPVSEAVQVVEALRARGQPVWYMNALNGVTATEEKHGRLPAGYGCLRRTPCRRQPVGGATPGIYTDDLTPARFPGTKLGQANGTRSPWHTPVDLATGTMEVSGVDAMIDEGTRERVVRVRNLQEYFHDSINDVVARQRVEIDPHAAHYVVNLLTIFSRSSELYEEHAEHYGLRPLALMLAEAANTDRFDLRNYLLQRIGDVALFITGFFADGLAGKAVDVDYYIYMGGNAYDSLSEEIRGTFRGRTFAPVYKELAAKFQVLVDVLNRSRRRRPRVPISACSALTRCG